ncbi:MAG TPA: beta-galactosidase [Candidatus Brocadiia bacterium]|nr:beta-galactosidase [Candidatus Brocadiia bacterium]
MAILKEMLRAAAVCVAAAASCAAGARAADNDGQYARFLETPAETVEGETFKVKVEYDLKGNEDTLHFETKREDGEHVRSCCDAQTVKGKGTWTKEFKAPLCGEARQLRFHVWTGMNWMTPRTPILLTDPVPVMSKAGAENLRAKMVKWQRESGAMLEKIKKAERGKGLIALVEDTLPGLDKTMTAALSRKLEASGYKVITIGAGDLGNVYVLKPEHFDLLIVPSSQYFPADASRAFRNYLRAAGKVMLLGGPPLTDSVSMVGGEWITASRYDEQLKTVGGRKTFLDFEDGDVKRWERGGDLPVPPGKWNIAEKEGHDGGKCFHALMPSLAGWETYVTSFDKSPFEAGDSLTCLWAKGNPRTQCLLVEWEEADGARWIATVSLTDKWQRYVLPPESFRFWESNAKRGFAGDVLNPRNAKRLNIGLARTHGAYPGDGPLEFFVDDFGVAPNPYEGSRPEPCEGFDPMDMIYPSYKFFPVTTASQIVVSPEMTRLVGEDRWSAPQNLYSVQPRPRGTGYLKGRRMRFIPILEARTADGRWCGVPAAMMVHDFAPFKGGVWASFCIPGSEFYKSDAVLNLLASTASRMIDGRFLYEGGTQYWTYFSDQKVRQGARCLTLGKEKLEGAKITLDIRRKGSIEGDGQEFDAVPGRAVERELPPIQPGTGEWISTVILSKDGKFLDMLEHEVSVWEPKPAAQRRFVSMKDGEFVRDGKPFYPYGSNYMPSSGIGTEDGEYFEHWVGARAYDPEIIQRDIDAQVRLGANAAAVFCHIQSADDQNVVDLLMRMERAGMMANLSIRPGTPLAFEWAQWKRILERNRIAENDNVMSLDIAWEPNWGNTANRRQYDPQWRAWIVERYGSVRNAEKDWGCPAPQNEKGEITTPDDKTATWDNEKTRRMVVAYRRFQIDLLCAAHDRAKRLLRTVTPNHLVSFRMADAGNPTCRWEGAMMYDLRGSAPVLDFLAPEAYGRIGEWERVKPGAFEIALCRMLAPGKPVIWAEMGCSTWDMKLMSQNPGSTEFQGKFYADFMKMMLMSHSNGYFYWWYPGGFRVGENSDFGIISPDGALRPCTKVVMENAEKFKGRSGVPAPDYWITVDLDATSDGVAGVYDRHQKEYWEAVAKGRTVGLKTRATGTDSRNCPLTAVGGTACNGTNPPEHLNALIAVLEVEEAGGKWRQIENGGQARAGKGGKARIRATVVNLTEPEWIKPGDPAKPKEGEVFLAFETAGVARKLFPIPANVPYMGEVSIGPFEIETGSGGKAGATLRMTAHGRADFGNKFGFSLSGDR